MSTRTAMRDRLEIGQTWRRRRDRKTYRVRQIWRADRLVNLHSLGNQNVRESVTFSDLRRLWELVG